MGCVNAQADVSTVDVSNNFLDRECMTVATLNYCGIMNSPYEFYCLEFEKELTTLGELFIGLVPLYMDNFDKTKFKWNMGKIDLKFRIGRYSPLFGWEIGLENGKFISKERFLEKWQQVWAIEAPKVDMKYSEQEKNSVKMYDFIAMHALVKYVYNVESFDECLDKDPAIYIKTVKPFYELSFLDEDRKLHKIIENFSKLEADVFFFQQYSEYFYEYLKNRKEHHIEVDKTKDTMIIAKKASFKIFKTQQQKERIINVLSQEQKADLNWNDRTSVMITDKYIFLNGHLSSKGEKNKPQLEQLKKGLLTLKKSIPEYEIILGGDLNSFLKPQEPFSTYFNMYPEAEGTLTTIKKRTMTQGQFAKANKVVQESKDKIISTLPIKIGNVMYITGSIPEAGGLVPSNEHPFDHFVVVAKIKLKEINAH